MSYADVVQTIVSLPTQLKAHRAARGLSLRDVEAATGINNVTILNIENGKDYRVGNLIVLAEWLDRETTVRKPQVSPGVYRLGPARYPTAAVRSARERQPSGETGDAREQTPTPAHGTNSRRAGQESSDAGQNVQREMRGSA